MVGGREASGAGGMGGARAHALGKFPSPCVVLCELSVWTSRCCSLVHNIGTVGAVGLFVGPLCCPVLLLLSEFFSSVQFIGFRGHLGDGAWWWGATPTAQ